MTDKKQLKAPEHSTACLYGYALARLGLTDTPQMRVLFWDAHEALKWDEKTDRYIPPSAEGECSQCGQIQEPAAAQASEVTPVVVPDDMPSTEANIKYGESYGVDWEYEGKKAAPAAVAVPDERAAFEVGILKYTPHAILDCHDGQYVIPWVQAAWTGWQARAALAATPAAAATSQGPVTWMPGPNEFKDWCAQWFGPDSDDSYLAKAVYDLPPMAQRFQRHDSPAAAAPVVLPESDAVINEVMELVKDWAQRDLIATEAGIDAQLEEVSEKQYQEAKRLDGEAETAYRAIEAKLRAALLAGVSAPAGVVEPKKQKAIRYDLISEFSYRENADYNALCELVRACTAQADARNADGMYYLQDARWSAMVGNCPSFWRLGGGYTTSLDDAERFTLEAAMKQHKCRETDLPWLCSELDKLRRPTIDCQYMPRSWDDQRAAIAAQAAQQGGDKQ